MSGSDDVPDYLKGVDNDFKGKDDFTIRPDRDAPLGEAPVKKRDIDPYDDDDGDDDEPRRSRNVTLPLQILFLVFAVVVGIGLLGAAGVAAFGTWISDAEQLSLSTGGTLARVVDEERKIIDELSSRGGNRSELMALYAAIDGADGHDRGRLALVFALAVDHEVVAIGDVRGSAIYDRQQKLTAAQNGYEEAMQAWKGAAYNPVGRVAVAVGIANGPPAP